jgi:hypothetical protein
MDDTGRLRSDDVTGSSPYRRYRATATDLWVLCPRQPGQPCPLHGLAKDHCRNLNSAQLSDFAMADSHDSIMLG